MLRNLIGGNAIIGVARGGNGVMAPSKVLEHIVMLCFEMRFFKQNGVFRRKSNILVPRKFLGWLRH